MSTRFPTPRHVRVWVWSSHGAHHWRVRDCIAQAGGEARDREEAWACAISAMLGALRLRQIHDAVSGNNPRSGLR